jgi:hypothetical protein
MQQRVCSWWFLGGGSVLRSVQRRWAGGGTGGERGSQGRTRRAQGRGGGVLWCTDLGAQKTELGSAAVLQMARAAGGRAHRGGAGGEEEQGHGDGMQRRGTAPWWPAALLVAHKQEVVRRLQEVQEQEGGTQEAGAQAARARQRQRLCRNARKRTRGRKVRD